MIELCCILAGIFLLLVLFYLLSMAGRRNHPLLSQLRGWKYAHRGLHDSTRPENSMAAFRAAVEQGYGMELDIHLLKDGSLAVIHDSLLARTTGQEGRVEDLTRQDLTRYFLEGSDQTIPTFQELLDLVDGRVPLVVELKCVDNNYAALTETACRVLDNYQGLFCLESFDPRCIQWLKKYRPELVRGQLAENSFKMPWKTPWILKLLLTNHMGNFLSRPDFVAYRFSHRKNLSTFLVRKLWKVQGVSWTLQSPEEFDTAVAEGWIPIFENFTP